jgi:DNA-binding PadR family transcriptional regulator
MLSHLLLGLLRDGVPRHGYQLMTEYRARAGIQANPGNVYRQLAKMVVDGLIEEHAKAADADPRRIPYRIRDRGRHEFDSWMLSLETCEQHLDSWLLFADKLSVQDRQRLLTALQDGLWMKSKTVARRREETAAKSRRLGVTGYQPAQLLRLRRTKLLTAELEFLDELRRELSTIDAAPRAIQSDISDATPADGDRPKLSRRATP